MKHKDMKHEAVGRGVGPLKIVYEDRDLIVIDKPPGLLTSTVPRERRPTAAALLRQYLDSRQPRARLGIIHRLDRDASGLLVFSKNDAAYRSLKQQFFHHTVQREYEAVVSGHPEKPRGKIQSRLVEYADGTVHSTTHPAKGQVAVTEYEVIGRRDDITILKVRLHTGRKHQIRAHLSERGWPIAGDTVYGRNPADKSGLKLRAVKLAIRHPRTGKPMVFTAAGLPAGPEIDTK
jgi:23S rRNA pseudouridine1911/1915/1917 synthase